MKNRNFFFLLLLFSSSFLLPITPREERAIRKDLYAKYGNKALVDHQLIEPDLSLDEVINRDLSILIEHKNKLQGKIDFRKSFGTRRFIPFCNKILAGLYGVISGATGLFTFGMSSAINNEWNGKNSFQRQVQNKSVEWASWFGFMNTKDVAQYNQYKFDQIVKDHPEFTSLASAVPVAAIVCAITGILFLKKTYTIYKYHGRVDACIKKIQVRLDRDQAVIVQLKNIKHQNA